MSATRILSPSAAAAIDDLPLAARLIVEGARSGRHRSPFHGFTAEFSQHRPYRPGDDLKHLDWKLLARTDRLYSRQFRETTNLAVMLAIDTSRSMDFPAEAAADGSIAKLRYAILSAAAFAHVVVEQGDAVGLMSMAGGQLSYLPPRGGRPQLHAVLTRLARLQASDGCDVTRVAARAGELLKRRGVVVVLSDFYDATPDTWREFRRLGRRGHDVTLLQILSRAEVAFPYTGAREFEDLETGGRRTLDAGEAAAAYRDGIAAFLADCRTQALRDGHDHHFTTTDVTPERMLRAYLLRRARQAARGVRAGTRP